MSAFECFEYCRGNLFRDVKEAEKTAEIYPCDDASGDRFHKAGGWPPLGEAI